MEKIKKDAKTQGVAASKKTTQLNPKLSDLEKFMVEFKKTEKLMSERRQVETHLNKIQEVKDVDHKELEKEPKHYSIEICCNNEHRGYVVRNRNLVDKLFNTLETEFENKITEIDESLLK